MSLGQGLSLVVVENFDAATRAQVKPVVGVSCSWYSSKYIVPHSRKGTTLYMNQRNMEW